MKKLLTGFLSLFLVLTLIPVGVNAFAEEAKTITFTLKYNDEKGETKDVAIEVNKDKADCSDDLKYCQVLLTNAQVNEVLKTKGYELDETLSETERFNFLDKEFRRVDDNAQLVPLKVKKSIKETEAKVYFYDLENEKMVKETTLTAYNGFLKEEDVLKVLNSLSESYTVDTEITKDYEVKDGQIQIVVKKSIKETEAKVYFYDLENEKMVKETTLTAYDGFLKEEDVLKVLNSLSESYTVDTENTPKDYEVKDGQIQIVVKKSAETKTVYVSYIDVETKTQVGKIEKIKVEANATTFHSSLLTLIPEGYKLVLGTGDLYVGEGNTLNVEVEKEMKTVYVSYVLENGKPLENAIETITLESNATYFNASILKEVPEGYTLVTTGDVYIGENDTVNVKVREVKAEDKVIYVSYILENGKPLENAIENIVLPADATYFNTSILTEVPGGYEVVEQGDVYIGENDTVNVKVRLKAPAEKTVYVSYILENGEPLENAIETITLESNATYFNTSVLKEVPAGYVLCKLGDVYIGTNDTVNVEVRKLSDTEKVIYVSYIDEETKIPFENGIEAVVVKGDATYFNTSVLKEVPAGYELCVTGDVYFGTNDTVNVEVRKSQGIVGDRTVFVEYIEEGTNKVVGKDIVVLKVEETVFHTNRLTKVPAGYVLCVAGDLYAPHGEELDTPVTIQTYVRKAPVKPTPTPRPDYVVPNTATK